MRPGVDHPAMRLTSPAFGDGERIPRRFGYTEANVNPPLAVWGVPDEAASLALVVDDPDAVEPAGKVWDHWLVWNIPPGVAEIPADSLPEDAETGVNDFGERGWGGPDPPAGEHTYRFLLYALDESIALDPDATKDDLYDAIEGTVVAKAELRGTYPP